MTRYYIDSEGIYIGGFDGVSPPSGAVEVDAPPEHASYIRTGNVWVKSPERRAAEAKAAAVIRIQAIREELVEHLATNLTGTSAEKGQALAAIGLLRAELGLEKAKT